jgi:glycosyltransferase involved in cell wall biosynthesis
MKWCVVIPTFNNCKTLEQVLQDVLHVTTDIIVVNDGSTDYTQSVLDKYPNVKCIHYAPNRGKGYALQKGFEQALAGGFEYAVTIDSDGQHFASDIPAFIKKSKEMPNMLIVGARTLKNQKLRTGSGFANKFSNFWFRFISGVSLPDTQSGFRMYPLHRIGGMRFFSSKYEFELEVLIRSAWKGIPLTNIPINVFYPEKEERVSHYRPFRDFVRISLLNTLCVFVAIFYVKPLSFLRQLKRENIKKILSKNIVHTTDSVAKLTLSVMLGIFMGIVPIWGYQLISAIGLAYLFRLNIVVVAVAANISIFPMTAVVVYLSYITGGFILSSNHHLAFNSAMTVSWFRDNIFQYIIGSIALAVIASVFFGILTYVLLKIYRKPAHID